MGRVFLLRHGQASFGADDYDHLSDKGHVQCQRLGAHWQGLGLHFGAVLRGGLRRHAQSLASLQNSLQNGLTGAPQATTQGATTSEVHQGLNEYDAEALIRALHAARVLPPLPRLTDASAAREHFRQLREALALWMQGSLVPEGMPTHAAFKAGVLDALAQAHARSKTSDVLVVSSGGPISVALASLLGMPDEGAIALNLRMRNSAVSELASTARGYDVVSVNTVPHLENPSAQAEGLLTGA
jgi:broad specificity phosphatase PhoE